MKKFLSFLTLSLLLPALCFGAQGEQEKVIRRSLVPSSPPYQGEVRLLHRNSAAVVQILLNSKVMNRVVGAIQEKEAKGWQDQREGAADSRQYTEELVQAYKTVKDRANGGRRLQLMIEFLLDGKRSDVAFYLPTLEEKDGGFVAKEKELLKKLPLSRGYVRRNMKLILSDSFRVDGEEAAKLLQRAEGGA